MVVVHAVAAGLVTKVEVVVVDSRVVVRGCGLPPLALVGLSGPAHSKYSLQC